jgi:hypothetical protein
MNVKNDREFFQEQLFEAKAALFAASSLKQVRFLQNKIKYLEQRMSEVGK